MSKNFENMDSMERSVERKQILKDTYEKVLVVLCNKIVSLIPIEDDIGLHGREKIYEKMLEASEEIVELVDKLRQIDSYEKEE